MCAKKKTKNKAVKNIRQQSSNDQKLIFGRVNYIWMIIGVVLVFGGLLLMTGGKMPSPEVWDESIIYGFRRTVLAPIVILTGFVIEVFAIFKRSEQ
jgi:hypothetical protein